MPGRSNRRMCYGWQEVRSGLYGLFLAMGLLSVSSSAFAAGTPRMTVELAWRMTDPASDRLTGSVELSVNSGKVLDIREVTAAPSSLVRRSSAGLWTIGSVKGGRVRVRLETPLDANLITKVAGQSLSVPIRAICDGSQELTTSDGAFTLSIERLSWDVVETSITGDGIAKPGATVSVSVGLNMLSADLAEINVRLVAELRSTSGDGPHWRQEWAGNVATNTFPAPSTNFNVKMPTIEGTYVLELKAAWDPPNVDTSRSPRRLFRRKTVSPNTVIRRLSLVVVGSDAGRTFAGVGAEVDSIDLARPRSGRTIATGRAPTLVPGSTSGWPLPDAALTDVARRDRIMGLIAGRSDPVSLPPADVSGLAWSAVTTRVVRTGRPHRLTLTVVGGDPEALAVALVEPPTGSRSEARLALDACGSGAPVVPGGPPTTFNWIVWPTVAEPVLAFANRSDTSAVQLGLVTLAELTEAPPLPVPEVTGRSVGLRYADRAELDRFGIDAWSQARNLADYLVSTSARTVVLPDGLADRAGRRALDGQLAEDSSGPDRLDLILATLARRGVTAWLDLPFEGTLPGLPSADSAEALARGIARVDRRGKADGPAYQLLHADVRAAMARRLTDALSAQGTSPNLAGVLVRLGPGSTLLGGPDTGLDDATYTAYVTETMDGVHAKGVPGLTTSGLDRFGLRARFVEGAGRQTWLGWRAAKLAKVYEELAEAVHKACPTAVLMVATPGLDDHVAGDEARRIDAAGQSATQAWLSVGLDFKLWPTGDQAPIVVRGVGSSPTNLAHDLATSPELDAQVALQSRRGLLLGLNIPRRRGPTLIAEPLAHGPLGDEPFGHALAALDPLFVLVSASSVNGQEERLRKFARVLHALPADAEATTLTSAKGLVSIRSAVVGSTTVISLANDTPYPIRVDTKIAAPSESPVQDLARGFRLAPETIANGHRVVLDLEPYGVSALRIGSADAKLESVTPLPPAAVLAGMKARYDDLSAVLARLNRLSADAKLGPPNPGFEPSAIQLATAAAPPGWHVAGNPSATVEIDPVRPHAGRGSLRLMSSNIPASVVSDLFPAPEGPSLTLTASLRADRPDTKARLWIDAESSGGRFTRHSDLVINPEWNTVRVRASGLPAGPLEGVRVRVEMLSPGSLWLDDLSISGAALSEVERLNARRALSSALQAYREQRYADFARLSGSHWAKRVDEIRPGGTADGLTRTAGEPSDLPRGRTLR